MNDTYIQGQTDAIKMVGNICGTHDCNECPVGQIVGESMTCFEFMQQYPAKALSLMLEESQKEYTYYNEYNTRFPYCSLSVDELADVVCCKAVFSGDTSCEGGDCKACWERAYAGEVEE